MRLTESFSRAVRWWGTLALIAVVFRTMQQIGAKDLVGVHQDSLSVLLAVDALIVVLFTPLVVVDVLRKLRAGRRLWHPGHGVGRNLLKWMAFDVARLAHVLRGTQGR